MINFTKLRKDIQDYDSEREKLIKQSRDVLKLSKQVIYAVHRDELAEAAKLIKDIEAEKKKLDLIAKHSRKMGSEGSYKVAIQEYAEALLYYHFVKDGKLVDLPIDTEHFILGLGDLPGELVKFDFRDNEVRRKFDAVKYDLRKLEDLVLDLKLKGR